MMDIAKSIAKFSSVSNPRKGIRALLIMLINQSIPSFNRPITTSNSSSKAFPTTLLQLKVANINTKTIEILIILVDMPQTIGTNN